MLPSGPHDDQDHVQRDGDDGQAATSRRHRGGAPQKEQDRQPDAQAQQQDAQAQPDPPPQRHDAQSQPDAQSQQDAQAQPDPPSQQQAEPDTPSQEPDTPPQQPDAPPPPQADAPQADALDVPGGDASQESAFRRAAETRTIFTLQPAQTMRDAPGDEVEGAPAPPHTQSSGATTQKYPSTIVERGDDFGRYQQVRLLSNAGGMGAVYTAVDPFLERTVALKVVRPDLVARVRGGTEYLERFISEAQIGAQLEHPNILPVHEFGRFDDGRVYFTMKYIRGHTLREHLNAIREIITGTGSSSSTAMPVRALVASLRKHRPGSSNSGEGNAAAENKPRVPPSAILRRDLLDKFAKLCDAVAFAHSHGVIHRDIKPENVMIGEFGEVLLADWGLAKVLNEVPEQARITRQVASPDGRSLSSEAMTRRVEADSSRLDTRELRRRAEEETQLLDEEAETGSSRQAQRGENMERLAEAIRLDFDRLKREFGLDLSGNEPPRTEAGMVMGTIGYMAPEQAAGDRVDHLADLFSLGCLLYEMVTLTPAFPQSGKVPRLRATAAADIKPANEVVANPQALGDLVPILNRTLQREPEDRYQSATDLAEDVQAVREWRGTQYSSWRTLLGNTLRRNAPIVLTATIMLAGIIALAAYLSTRPAHVTFTSEPAGATLYVDGEDFGPTPVEAIIRPGNYELRFAMPGYHTAVQDFDVGPAFRGEASRVFLRSSLGYVHVTCEPSEARILIRNAEGELVVDSGPEGRDVGYLWQQLQPGEYRIKCELPYFRDPTPWATIQVGDGNETTVHNVLMQSTRGRPVIAFSPPGSEVVLHPVDVKLEGEEVAEPVRATIPASGEWEPPLMPAGKYRLEVLDAPLPGWQPLSAEDAQVEVPANDGVITMSVMVRSRLGALRIDTPGVESLDGVLIDAEGERHRFRSEAHLAVIEGLPEGPASIELRTDEYELVGGDEATRITTEVVGGGQREVRIETRRLIGRVNLLPDDAAHGARLSLYRGTGDDDATTPALDSVTLPAEGVAMRPGTYVAEARQELYYPSRFELDIAVDRSLDAHITLEPVIKNRRFGPSPGRLVPAGDLELYPVRGDLDGDGADAILVRENDTLLVYSPMREEIVWPPIVVRELWDPHANRRSDGQLFAVAGDITGEGTDDLVLAFGDQVLGYKAPSGTLAFVRDARGRLEIRGLELMPKPEGQRGKRIVVVTDRALVCYGGFDTENRWALELDPAAAGMRPRVLALPEPGGAAYEGRIVLSDAVHGTLVIAADGTLEQHLPDVQVHAVHKGRVVYQTDRGVRLCSVAVLREAESAADLGEGTVIGRGIVSAVMMDDDDDNAVVGGGVMAVGVRDELIGGPGRVIMNLDAPHTIELPSAPREIERVRQGRDASLLVVHLDNEGRAFIDPASQRLLGIAAAHWISSSALRDLPGTGLALDTNGDGAEELLWLHDDRLEIVSLERANMLRAYRVEPQEIYVVERDGRREWLIKTPLWLEHLDAGGTRLGYWRLDFDDLVRHDSASGQVVIEPEAFAGFDSALRRTLFRAERIRALQPLTPGEPGELMLRERTGIVRVGSSGFVEQRLLSWPGNFDAAWVEPGLGVVTLDQEGVVRVCAPPPRESRTGALLLAWSMRQIRDEQEHRVEPHLAGLLERLPRSAHAHWVAGRLALARAEGATSEEREKEYRDEAMAHWEVAIEHNPNLIRARFDLANEIAEQDRWSRADRRRIRALLQPVFIARYRYARTVWLLLYEAVRSGNPERVSYYVEIFENTDAALDPEFMELRDHRQNPRYHDVRLWILRFLE